MKWVRIVKDIILGGLAMAFFFTALWITNSFEDYRRSQQLNGGHERPVKTLKKYYK